MGAQAGSLAGGWIVAMCLNIRATCSTNYNTSISTVRLTSPGGAGCIYFGNEYSRSPHHLERSPPC